MKQLFCVVVVGIWAGCCMASEPFKILSYNVRHCANMDNVRSEQATAAVIVREQARFVALQEMDVKTARVKGVDQPQTLARLTGMHATFAKAIPLQGGAYGVALLSREQPLSVKRIPLPGSEPRVLLLAEFSDCFFGTMHLDLVPQRRLESMPLVRQAVSAAAAAKPVFICGDWNDLPNSKTMKKLGEFAKVISTTKTPTFHSRSNNPRERVNKGGVIDYIAIDSGHTAGVKVIDTHVTEERWVSDHAPISVTVQL